uniref:Uncharacterized protein LOC102807813 n=1 Tax=Saccoglossus kowalevskii TaxID=10224 RepID=A0ABM0MRY7_SACKO|nr:PREDICTED: uncharacterized protein LOC102807813 [Saccoglossus kowalevskii]
MATTSNINRTLFCQFFTLPSSLHLCRQFLMLLILLYLPAGLCLNHCMLQQIYKNVIPYGGQSAGTFTPRDIDRHKFNSLDSLMEECGNICCQDDACDVVYVYNMKCYTLDCVNADMCEPIESLEGKETYMAFIARAMSSHLDELPGSTVGLTTSNTAQITLPNDETSDKVNGGDDTDELETLLNILGEEKTPQQTPNPAPSSQVTQPPIATDALNSVIPLPDKKNFYGELTNGLCI